MCVCVGSLRKRGFAVELKRNEHKKLIDFRVFYVVNGSSTQKTSRKKSNFCCGLGLIVELGSTLCVSHCVN